MSPIAAIDSGLVISNTRPSTQVTPSADVHVSVTSSALANARYPDDSSMTPPMQPLAVNSVPGSIEALVGRRPALHSTPSAVRSATGWPASSYRHLRESTAKTGASTTFADLVWQGACFQAAPSSQDQTKRLGRIVVHEVGLGASHVTPAARN